MTNETKPLRKQRAKPDVVLVRWLSLLQLRLEKYIARAGAQGFATDKAVAAHTAIDLLISEAWRIEAD